MILVLLVIIYILFGIFINACPVVYQWDEAFIIFVQNVFSFIPNNVIILFDDTLYHFFLFLPQIAFSIIFILKKKYLDIIFIWGVSYSSYLFNNIQKDIVCRPRPNLDLHIIPHPDSFSFVSNHTLINFTLYAVATYYVFTMCQNKFIKYSFLAFAIFWSLLMGFSRILLGVHNPTDIVAAFLLGAIFFVLFKYFKAFISKYIGS